MYSNILSCPLVGAHIHGYISILERTYLHGLEDELDDAEMYVRQDVGEHDRALGDLTCLMAWTGMIHPDPVETLSLPSVSRVHEMNRICATGFLHYHRGQHTIW